MAAIAGCSGEDDEGDSTTNSGDLDQVTYLTGFQRASHDAYAWVGRDLGIYEDAGIDIQIELGVGPTSGQALLAGSAQFAKIDMTTLMVQVGGGDAEGLIALAFVEQLNLCSIVVPEDSGITTPQDLEGRQLSALANAVPETLFTPYADLAGFNRDEVEIINGEPDVLYAMVASGDVDGVLTFTIQQGIIESVLEKPTLSLPYSDYLPDLGGNVVACTREFADENPDLATRFRDASLLAVQEALADPERAMEMMAEGDPAIDIQAGAEEIERIVPLVTAFGEDAIGEIDVDRVARSIGVLQANGLVPAGLEPDDVLHSDASLRA